MNRKLYYEHIAVVTVTVGTLRKYDGHSDGNA